MLSVVGTVVFLQEGQDPEALAKQLVALKYMN